MTSTNYRRPGPYSKGPEGRDRRGARRARIADKRSFLAGC